MRDLSTRAWIYLSSVVLIAAVAVVLVAHAGVPAAALGFGALFFLADMAPVRMKDAAYSVGFVIGVAALVALGPAAAAVAASFGGLVNLTRHRPGQWLPRVAFNSAPLSLTTAASGVTYVALGG